MIHAKGLRTFLLFATLAACCLSFLGAGCPPPGLTCQPVLQCPDGRSVKVCFSRDGSEGGYQVGSTYFPCESYPIDCTEAAERASALCLGNGFFAEDSSFTDLDEVDEAVIEEVTEDLLEAMDDLEESY